MPKPWENAEGYHDPTAYHGTKNIIRDEDEQQKRVNTLIFVLKYITRLAGFELLNRIEIKDRMRDCDPKDLVLALKGANSEVSNKIFQNMSTRMAQSIRDDLEITTNVRLRDVEEAQQRIVGIIRDLEEKNELIILKGGKDDIIA